MPGTLPPRYAEVLYWRITGKPARLIALNIAGLFLVVVFGVIFFGLAIRLGKPPAQFNLGLGEVGMIVVGTSLTLVLHELAHGLAMRIFGAKPQYGILWKQLMFYATSPGYAYRRNNYVVVALAPFAFISLLVVVAMWWLQGTGWVVLLAFCGVVNAAGAVGDLWITMIALRYAAAAYIMDERDGMRVFLPQPDETTQAGFFR